MTFYEAALRVLEAEGRPLHFSEITEKSIQQQLLSHVGKTPEQTMLSRLAAMARRTRDRKVVVTAKDTFALVDWLLPEDPEALAQTGVPEPNPEEDLPPLRPAERHPDPRNDNVRGAGRIDRERDKDRGRRRREEEEEGGRRRRRFPPIPEVAFEILSEAGGGLRADQLAGTAKERGLAGDDLGTEQILMALLEDNQRRIDAGRRPQFHLQEDSGQIVLERASAPSDIPPHELQAAFAQALNIPMEGGRPVLPRSAQPSAAAEEGGPEAAGNQAAKLAVKDARKSVARALRRKLSELDTGTFEKSVVKMLHGVGFRELKVAKRSKEGPLLTARKREGSVELRFAVRMLKGSPQIDRRMVQELRRDLGHYSAQVGLLASAGEVRGDARTEAQASGSLVMLWCGDALGEKFVEAKAGVSTVQVELFELDDQFFEVARIDAEEAARRREERQREKQQREAEAPPREERGEDEGREEEADNAVPSAAGGLAPPQPMEGEEGAEGDEGEEGDEDEGMEEAPAGGGAPREGAAPGGPEGAPGQPGQGERKRRRRRRRGRRGRGNRPEGAPGQPGQPGQQAHGQPGGQSGGQAAQGAEGGHPPPAAEAPRSPEPAAPPPPPPSSGGGEPGQG
jgi:ribonuclease E